MTPDPTPAASEAVRAPGHYWIETGNIKERWEVSYWTGDEWLRIDADDGRDVFPVGPRIPSPDEPPAAPASLVALDEAVKWAREHIKWLARVLPPDDAESGSARNLRILADAAALAASAAGDVRAFEVGADGWLPIESAPRDGTWFLACATAPSWGATRIVRFDAPDDRLPIHGEGNMWPSAPTHWRPLPEPPRATTTEAGNG